MPTSKTPHAPPPPPTPQADPLASVLGPALARALARKGYTELTPVQEAVLDPALGERDLRVTSQTGSGKTLAIGFALRALAEKPLPNEMGVARPRAIVVTPTRELARQVDEELAWLFAEHAGGVASLTGGASYREEGRALSKGPAVIVGTPGRLLDHLKRGTVDPRHVAAVVLDEADRMLEMGFREELDALFALFPKDRRTILVSATFAREVGALADRVQRDAAHVEGTRLGRANVDIEHVLHVVLPHQKLDALVNLLLAHPDDQTLVFARTRSDVADVAEALSAAGFSVGALSGELEQAARNRVMAAFKRGDLHVLVATDVAARGIDVQTVTRVVHLDVPATADSYTHRSGRTGRAGRKGTSALLATPANARLAERMLGRAGVAHRVEPIPSAEAIRAAADERDFAALTRDEAARETSAEAGGAIAPELEVRLLALAARIVAAGRPERAIARLLRATRRGGATEPREVQPVPRRESARRERGPREPGPQEPDRRERPWREGPRGERAPARGEVDTRERRPGGRDLRMGPKPAPAEAHERRGPAEERAAWVPFRVSFGAQHGADPRRLLALVCRRGGIRGHQVGAIRVERSMSIVNVAAEVAEAFARAASRPDPREPRILIRPDVPARSHAPPRAGPRAPAPAPPPAPAPRAPRRTLPPMKPAPKPRPKPRRREP